MLCGNYNGIIIGEQDDDDDDLSIGDGRGRVASPFRVTPPITYDLPLANCFLLTVRMRRMTTMSLMIKVVGYEIIREHNQDIIG